MLIQSLLNSKETKEHYEISSWTTGEGLCRDALANKKFDKSELNGWTVSLYDEDDCYELMGNDYVYDLISEMDIVPFFPVCDSHFLVSNKNLCKEPMNQMRKNMEKK